MLKRRRTTSQKKCKCFSIQYFRYDEALNQKELWYFAPRLGSFIERTNPALEFLKFTCKMFGLEKSLKGTVDILKRGCLRVLRIGEFDERSIFYEPTLELILPQATCHLCQSSFNLDICKEYDEEQNGWTCQDCGTLLKSNYIEKKMIDLLTSRMISYQIQDIECKNCKMIKNTVLGKICSCTGTFKNTH